MSNHRPRNRFWRRRVNHQGFDAIAIFRAVLLGVSVLLIGQTAAAQPNQPSAVSAPTPVRKPSARHHLRAAVQAPAPIQLPAPIEQPDPPPAPEVPHWPANDTPNKATVVWDSHGLRIDATNSSLHQILDEVATDTGAKIEGMGNDERVFGQFGPGETRDVLSQLLQGSGYNVIMVGDQGAGTPREVTLSVRRTGKGPSGANPQNQDAPDEDVVEQPESEEQPPQPPIITRPPMPPMPQGAPGVPRTPQQVLQELQQRQQQMQDQQQQQQPH